MPTNEELQNQIQELKNQIAALQASLNQLSTTVTQHAGTEFGAVQQLAPHPKQQIAVATFANGAMQIDKTGMQVVSGGSNTSAIHFTEDLSETPSTDTVRAVLSGYMVESTDVSVVGMQTNTSGSESVITLSNDADSSSVYWNIRRPSSSTSEVGVTAYMADSTSDKYVLIKNAPLGLHQTTSDFTVLADGQLWYRSDTDKIKARINGTTENLATESYVSGSYLPITGIPRGSGIKTIASGAITIDSMYHKVETESGAATDDLDTINGGTLGQILILKTNDSSHDVTLKDGTGNLNLAGDFTLDNGQDTITLLCEGTQWNEVARSNNG